MQYIRYNLLGQIISRGSVEAIIFAEKVLAGELLLESDAKPETHYVDLETNTVVEKTECLATLSGNVISNISLPAWLYVGNTCYELTEDFVVLEFSIPGTYSVRLVSVKTLDKTFDVVQS